MLNSAIIEILSLKKIKATFIIDSNIWLKFFKYFFISSYLFTKDYKKITSDRKFL